MARPQAKIDIVELEKLCGMQCTDEEMAAWFNVSTRTIERRRKNPRFNEVMEQAKAKGRVSVRRMLFRLAAAGNVAAVIFLAKNVLGYRDAGLLEHQIVDEHGKPARPGITIIIDGAPSEPLPAAKGRVIDVGRGGVDAAA
jgi:hypothetical protein